MKAALGTLSDDGEDGIENLEANMTQNHGYNPSSLSSSESSLPGGLPTSRSLNSSEVMVTLGGEEKKGSSESKERQRVTRVGGSVDPGTRDTIKEPETNKKAVDEILKEFKELKSRDDHGEGHKGSSKGAIILNATLDLALAGLFVAYILSKRPGVDKSNLGIGAIGLSILYGAQWYAFKKWFTDSN
ncbi:hypothetical protein G9A89_021295 [Geosiphon pyriformis]|nr:hypothetical protein G9A89_021295 [Geosiphon pyriformis]